MMPRPGYTTFFNTELASDNLEYFFSITCRKNNLLTIIITPTAIINWITLLLGWL
jgi:hypothetical protein